MKKKKDVIVINKKALIGIAPAIGIIVVLLARDKAPEALLFLMGIILGAIIVINSKK